jgi:predicted DNA-binding protein
LHAARERVDRAIDELEEIAVAVVAVPRVNGGDDRGEGDRR